MVSSNATSSNPKRRSLPWIGKSKTKAEKACFCKLQSPDARRRYLRRGSKTSKMLWAAKNGLDESGQSCTNTPPTSSEFSLSSDSQEFSFRTLDESDSSSDSSSIINKKKVVTWKDASPLERKRHSVSVLTSALAIVSLVESEEEYGEQ